MNETKEIECPEWGEKWIEDGWKPFKLDAQVGMIYLNRYVLTPSYFVGRFGALFAVDRLYDRDIVSIPISGAASITHEEAKTLAEHLSHGRFRLTPQEQ